MNRKTEQRPIVLVGLGLVGCLESLLLAQSGFDVAIYEKRGGKNIADFPLILPLEHAPVDLRSLNLAISERGLSALELVGLRQTIIDNSLPLSGRICHYPNGKSSQYYYSPFKKTTYSIDRNTLFNLLYARVKQMKNIQVNFGCECKEIQLDTKTMRIIPSDNQREEFKVNFDFLIGTDGSYSGVRNTLLRKERINFEQFYANHVYKELVFLCSAKSFEFFSKSFIHIFPRGESLIVAMPNATKYFTFSLFMTLECMKIAGDNVQDNRIFFTKNYPELVELFGIENIIKAYNTSPVGYLVNAKCSKFHYKDSLVLLGDAAHAMVPFLGQGVNCGFEDCSVLHRIMERNNFHDIEKIFNEYSNERVLNTNMAVDMANRHYNDMSKKMAHKMHYFEHFLIEKIHQVFNERFIPFYSMISFTNIPYKEVYRLHKRNQLIVYSIMLVLAFFIVMLARLLLLRIL